MSGDVNLTNRNITTNNPLANYTNGAINNTDITSTENHLWDIVSDMCSTTKEYISSTFVSTNSTAQESTSLTTSTELTTSPDVTLDPELELFCNGDKITNEVKDDIIKYIREEILPSYYWIKVRKFLTEYCKSTPEKKILMEYPILSIDELK